MTWSALSAYSPISMEGSHYRFAFVIKFRPETDVEAGRFEGKVEHIASYEATKFYSLEEMLSFIVRILTEVAKQSDCNEQGE